MTPESTSNGNVVATKQDLSRGERSGFNRRTVFMRKLWTEGENAVSEYMFQPPSEGEDVVEHSILLKRVVLSPDADPNDLCIVEVETKIDTGDMQVFPLAFLRLSDSFQVPLDLYLVETAKLKLAKGKGPVFIIGEYAEEWRDDAEAVDESLANLEEEDEEGETEEEDASAEDKENGASNGIRSGKRKLKASTEDLAAKKSKKEQAQEGAEPMEANEPESEKTSA